MNYAETCEFTYNSQKLCMYEGIKHMKKWIVLNVQGLCFTKPLQALTVDGFNVGPVLHKKM